MHRRTTQSSLVVSTNTVRHRLPTWDDSQRQLHPVKTREWQKWANLWGTNTSTCPSKKKYSVPQYRSPLHVYTSISTLIPSSQYICFLSTHARTAIARFTHPTDGSTGNPHSRGRSDHCLDDETEKNLQAFSGVETTCGQRMQVRGLFVAKTCVKCKGNVRLQWLEQSKDFLLDPIFHNTLSIACKGKL